MYCRGRNRRLGQEPRSWGAVNSFEEGSDVEVPKRPKVVLKSHYTYRKDQGSLSDEVSKAAKLGKLVLDRADGIVREEEQSPEHHNREEVKATKLGKLLLDRADGIVGDKDKFTEHHKREGKSESSKYALTLKSQDSSKLYNSTPRSRKRDSKKRLASSSTQKLLEEGIRELRRLKRKQKSEGLTFYFRLPKTIEMRESSKHRSQGTANNDKEDKSVEKIRGVGPINAARLTAKGVTTVRNLYGQFLIKGSRFPQYLKSLGVDTVSAARINSSLKSLDANDI